MIVNFVGYDSFGRAVFKGEDGYFYGNTDLKKAEDIFPCDLEYFGTKFDCEPEGGAPLKKITKVAAQKKKVFDDLSEVEVLLGKTLIKNDLKEQETVSVLKIKDGVLFINKKSIGTVLKNYTLKNEDLALLLGV